MNTRKAIVGSEDAEVCAYLEVALRRHGYVVRLARDGAEIMECLANGDRDLSLAVVDIRMRRQDGTAALRQIRRASPRLPIIAFSDDASPAKVAEAMRNGATDFLAKPLTQEHLARAIRDATQNGCDTLRGASAPFSAISLPPACGNPKMQMIRSGIKQIAVSDVPVVIRGESGVGKEVLAREIHAESARANKPFMKINCAAVPQELLESELFGYERGAFTGAMKSTPGKFEVADGGTILLDEIGDMDFKLQAKLLHVLQDSEFQRLGGPDIVRVNVRVLAATHCDLEQAILAKRFREDLYYRLNVITIELPPLRERRDEIIRLAEFFLQKHAVAGMPVPTISASLAQSLLEHAWPGNIRELENVMRKFLVFRDAEALAEELRGKARIFAHPPATLPAVSAGDTVPLSALDAVDEARKRDEANAIVQALDATHWNRKRAAALLCVDYKVLLYRMKKLGIGPSESAANQDRTEEGDIRPPSTERVHYAGA